jgi:RND superfamily putative drug exporter
MDATIVRTVLVPATMELLGDRNWWFPAWLDRLIPNISVEAHGEDVIDLTDAALAREMEALEASSDARQPVAAGSR